MNIQTVTFNGLSFVNVINPGQLEIKYLRNNFNFSQLHLDDYLEKTQVPKIEIFKNYSLIVLDFPYFYSSSNLNKNGQSKTLFGKLQNLTSATPIPALPQFSSTEKKKRILIGQVDLFVGKDYLVVIHDGTLLPIDNIFMQCQKTLQNRNKYMGQGSVFLAYNIINALVDICFPIMNVLTSAIDKIDRDLEKDKYKETIEDISLTRRNLVFFQTIIKPIIPIFRQLEEGRYKELNGNMQPFWSNILDHLLKIWDRIEDSRELIEGISESHESYLASRTNEIIKILTIFSAVVLPLNLFASMYGMNIQLPFGNFDYTFFMIAVLMLATSLAMLAVFRIKKWF